MLILSETDGRDQKWPAAWFGRLKETYPNIFHSTQPYWAASADYWILKGLQLVIDGRKKHIDFLFLDGKFGYCCVGIRFNSESYIRKIINGADLETELMTVLKSTTNVDQHIESDSIEQQIANFLKCILNRDKLLSKMNVGFDRVAAFEVPVTIEYDGDLDTWKVATDLATRRSKTVNYVIKSDSFANPTAFWEYANSYFTAFFKQNPLHENFRITSILTHEGESELQLAVVFVTI